MSIRGKTKRASGSSVSLETPSGFSALRQRLARRKPKLKAANLQSGCDLSQTLKATASFTFQFDPSGAERRTTDQSVARLHDQIMREQAFALAGHVREMGHLLAIDDLYAHPLIRRQDILTGHCMTAFIGAPIRGEAAEIAGVICAIDAKPRRWSDSDISSLQRIVAQMESCHVPRQKIYGTL